MKQDTAILLTQRNQGNKLRSEGDSLHERVYQMQCVWCGTKGGFVNNLVIHLTFIGDKAHGITECSWCMKATTFAGTKEQSE